MFKIVHRLSNDETPSLSLVISEASRLSAPYDYLLIPNNRLLAKRKHSIGSVTLGMEIRKPAAELAVWGFIRELYPQPVKARK